jgi:cell filamentation protein
MRDPYVYKGTNVLINTLNIKDHEHLEFVEKEFTTVRLKDIERGILTQGAYDVRHYRQFHRHIFGDIYPWAGDFRTINILKHETALNGLPLEFMDHEAVESHLSWCFSRMNQHDWESAGRDERTYHLARCMSEIWRAHAFREGNTRTTITFVSQFAKHRGFPLDSSLFARHAAYMRSALVASVFQDEILEKERNYEYLERIIKEAITLGED